jgi:uncharacterized protein YjbI with pentapeptide repeats
LPREDVRVKAGSRITLTMSLRHELVQGEMIHFQGNEPSSARTIQAGWLAEAAEANVQIDIKNAIISGLVTLRFVTFQKEVSLDNCVFLEVADFSHSTFKRNISFHNSIFQRGATFQAALLEKYGSFDGITIEGGDGDFTDIYVGNGFSAKQAIFRDSGRAVFCRARLDKSADFRGAHFHGKSDFTRIEIDSDTYFGGTVFHRDTDFSNAHFRGDALFRSDLKLTTLPSAVFEGEASFIAAQIDGHGAFDGVQFKDNASFNGAHFKGAAFFRENEDRKLPAVVFEREADFTAIEVSSYADFGKARFLGLTKFSGARISGGAIFNNAQFQAGVTFYGASIHEHSFFDRVTFEAKVDFREVFFGSGVVFRGAAFQGKSRFDSATFKGLADFGSFCGDDGESISGASFTDVIFDYADFEGDARFEQAVFSGPTKFYETTFRALQLADTGFVDNKKQFADVIDLRGCLYDRIQTDWKCLLDQLKPYDRQPYMQLESAMRRAGQDRAADDIYLARQKVERERHHQSQQYGPWLMSWSYKLLANYGVRPYRLAVLPVILVLLGTLFFSQPSTVQPRDAKDTITSARLVATGSHLSLWSAFGFSLHQFLPVDIPTAAELIPSPQPVWSASLNIWVTPANVATFLLRLPGWILVPLGVGALAGLLRRKAS